MTVGFALNALGQTLRSNAPMSMAGMARFVGHPAYREHWSGLLDAVRTGEAVPPKLRGMSGWDFMAQTPDLAAVFNDAMTSASEFAVDPVVAAYDFASLPNGGHRCRRRPRQAGGGDHHGDFSGASGVLYDLPQVVEGAPELLQRYGVADRSESRGLLLRLGARRWRRIRAQERHPRLGRRGIRDDSEQYPGGGQAGCTLLLVEFVIPDHDREFIGKWADMEMLVHVGARERTAEDYRKLDETSRLSADASGADRRSYQPRRR